MALPVVILSSDSEQELDDIALVNQARGQVIESRHCHVPASMSPSPYCGSTSSLAGCEPLQKVRGGRQCTSREHTSDVTGGRHGNSQTLTESRLSPYLINDSSSSGSDSGRDSAELRVLDDRDPSSSSAILQQQPSRSTVDVNRPCGRTPHGTARGSCSSNSSDEAISYSKSVSDAASHSRVGHTQPGTAGDSSGDESSDDGDFYSKSVSDIFSKRQICSTVQASTIAKRACLSSSASSHHAAAPDSPSLGCTNSVDDSFDDERPARRMPIVRTPSPPPELKPRASKRRRANLVDNAISELERYKDVSEQLSADTCELASPVEATVNVRQRTVFIMVKLHSSTEKFRIGMDDALSCIVTTLAEKENVNAARIALYFNDSQVAASDTPGSLGFKTGEILECLILPLEDPMKQGIMQQPLAQSDDVIQLKVQDRSGLRSRTVMNINKKEPLQALMDEFALKKGVSVDSLTFHFDGDEISGTATCDDIGLEDGFCIDVSTR